MKSTTNNQSPFYRRNACLVTPTVQSLSQHRATFHKYFYSPRHFPNFLAGTMIAWGFVGYTLMEWYWTKRMEDRAEIYIEAYHRGGERREEKSVALMRKLTFNNSQNRGVDRGLNRRVLRSFVREMCDLYIGFDVAVVVVIGDKIQY